MNACTIVARNYLAFARVVAGSFMEHHPDGRFWVLVIDDLRHEVDDTAEPFTVLRLDDIDLDSDLDSDPRSGPGELHRMATIYDVTELATAVKPWLLRHLLTVVGEVAYLDPDICVFAPLDGLRELAREHGIVLTPHTVDPIPRDGLRPSEGEILASGVYNLGFLGVGQAAVPMLEWWSQRLARDCIIDHQQMLFTDQRWIDLVPGYYPHHIVESRAWNVAYWNLHGRPVTWTGEHYAVAGEPLRFFHFSGYKPELPERLSKHQGEAPRIVLAEHPDLRKICDEYADRLRAAGYGQASREPYAWDTTPGGDRLDVRARRVYRTALIAHERDGAGEEPPNPFADGADDRFLAWLNAAPPGQPGSPPVSRYLLALWAERPDVQAAFPEVPGKDSARYLRWVLADGAGQVALPDVHLPDPPSAAAAAAPAEVAATARRVAGRARRALQARSARAAAPRTVSETTVVRPSFAHPDDLAPGVNVAGYFKAELGVGEGGRLVLDTIEAAGVDHSTVTTTKTSNRQDHPFVDRGRSGAPYDVSVICVNADQTPHFARDVGPEFFDGRYTIGMWHWEVEDFPPVMHPGLDFVDEVWCGSEFAAASVRKSTDKPVYAFTLPITVPAVPAGVSRADLGLPDDQYVFCFAFDFFSILERKNPMAVIEAFSRAFDPGEGPLLLLKSVNGHRRPDDLERLRAAAAGRPDIVIRDEYLSAEHKAALMGLVDCYVSLHRSEGFGLTVGEAMALGKPVITTAYSGTMDFTTDDNSFLVPYALVDIPAGCDPYPVGSHWAEADVVVAAAHMRTVVDEPDVARARGEQAARDIVERHAVASRVPFVHDRLAAIRARREGLRLAAEDVRHNLEKWSPILDGVLLPPERGLDRAVRLVNAAPDVRSATDKGAAAHVVRRVMRRLTNHQTQHQHEVNMALAVAVHELSERFEREVNATVRDELAAALTNGWSYELGVQMRAHLYSLLVDNGMARMQTYDALAAYQQRLGEGPLAASELRVFSQNGEDGVLAELLRRLGDGGRYFVEFGIESGREGNCVLLADVLGWRGLFIEADDDFHAALAAKYAGSGAVTALRAMVTPETVSETFRSAGVPAEPDLLSIDVDGNDYWIWQRLDAAFRPRIVVVEYNSSLGPDRALVQPQSETWWDKTDFYGASIAALCRLAADRGYSLVYQELSGNNAFFVRDDLLPSLGDIGPVPPRAPNYSLNAERHPADPQRRQYLDLETGTLVDRPA